MTSTSEPTIIELDSDFDDNDIEVIRRGGPSPKTMLRNVWGNKWIWLRVFGNGVMTFLKGVIFQMALFLKVPLLFFIAPFLHLQLCKFPFLRLELLEPVSSLSGCSFLWWFKAFHYFILTQILRRTFRTFWKSSLFYQTDIFLKLGFMQTCKIFEKHGAVAKFYFRLWPLSMLTFVEIILQQ